MLEHRDTNQFGIGILGGIRASCARLRCDIALAGTSFVHKAKSESEHRSTGLGLGFGFEAQIGDLEVGGSLGSWGPRSVLFGLRS